jgi:hypothetical protein
MATDPGQGTTPPAKKGDDLYSRMLAPAVGACLGAVVANMIAPNVEKWDYNLHGPVLAALGAALGVLLDIYVLSGGKEKDGGVAK